MIKKRLMLGAIATSSVVLGGLMLTPKAQALVLSGCVYGSLVPGQECSGLTNQGKAYFEAINPSNASGTGVFQPFQTSDITGGGYKDKLEEGINTDINNILDNKPGGTAGGRNKDVLLDSIGITKDSLGRDTVQFTLDMNEPNNKTGYSFLDLVEVKIYVATQKLTQTELKSITSGTFAKALDELAANPSGTIKKLFDLDQTVFLRDQNSGQGRADLTMSLSAAIFEPYRNTGSYLYFYNAFQRETSNFEEWSYSVGSPYVPPTPVPTPAVVLPIIGSMIGAASRRKKDDSTEA